MRLTLPKGYAINRDDRARMLGLEWEITVCTVHSIAPDSLSITAPDGSFLKRKVWLAAAHIGKNYDPTMNCTVYFGRVRGSGEIHRDPDLQTLVTKLCTLHRLGGG